nr:hypothetical protein [uncultured Mucilaginibacter sp.]
MQSNQTLFIPDRVIIEFTGNDGSPFKQENILIGIRTHASRKNDIDLSPFVTNTDGRIDISREEILKCADIFISYGLMDYIGLEYAKPHTEIYFLGNSRINIYLGTEIDPELEKSLSTYIPDWDIVDYKQQSMERAKDKDDYELYTNCYNRSTKIIDNVILAKDNWSKKQAEVFYKVAVPS